MQFGPVYTRTSATRNYYEAHVNFRFFLFEFFLMKIVAISDFIAIVHRFVADFDSYYISKTDVTNRYERKNVIKIFFSF